METTTKESPIIQKAMELCRAVAEQPDFQALKAKVDAFMGDELVKFQFQQVNELGDLLQMRQRGGLAIKEEEIAHFESLRGELLGNPVAQGFIEAQEEMQKLHESIGRFVNKTFELGRSPDTKTSSTARAAAAAAATDAEKELRRFARFPQEASKNPLSSRP